MSGPEAHVPASGVATLERSREDVLGAARPLPPDEDVVIRELSEEEDRLFLGQSSTRELRLPRAGDH